ncbi:MAG: helix-turn-helix transcriptional regulator, partial [Bacteroidales bacterium]
MKKETFKDYFERINRILLYINSNLGDNLDLKKLAEMSNFSLFHFHRIMRAYLGESLGEYIQRIRLETSHHLLRHTMEPVREIALKVGYDSPSSFNKAFMKRFGITPSSVRNRIGGSEFHFLNPFIKTIVMNPVVLKPKLVVLKEKKVVYVQSIGKY